MGTSNGMIDRHSGYLARDGREHAIKLTAVTKRTSAVFVTRAAGRRLSLELPSAGLIRWEGDQLSRRREILRIERPHRVVVLLEERTAFVVNPVVVGREKDHGSSGGKDIARAMENAPFRPFDVDLD